MVVPYTKGLSKSVMENGDKVGTQVARTIKEAMLIRVNNPSFNRNIWKYQLPHIWDVLLNIPDLHLK